MVKSHSQDAAANAGELSFLPCASPVEGMCSELVDYTRSYLQTDKFGLHFESNNLG